MSSLKLKVGLFWSLCAEKIKLQSHSRNELDPEKKSDVFCCLNFSCFRDEWAEAIQMVAESLAKQEEEGILCSPTSQIENVNEEEMDTSISHYKRKVRTGWKTEKCPKKHRRLMNTI